MPGTASFDVKNNLEISLTMTPEFDINAAMIRGTYTEVPLGPAHPSSHQKGFLRLRSCACIDDVLHEGIFEQGDAMKRSISVCIGLLVSFVVPTAFGWIGQWSNHYPFAHHDGGPIQPGSLIQLIHAGPNGAIDDPATVLTLDEIALWLELGCPPVGDDTLRDETVFIDYGPGYEGYFGKWISGTDDENGDPWYTRFFGAPKYEVVWTLGGLPYAHVGDPYDPDDPIYELVLTGWGATSYDFGDYKIRLQDVRLPPIPEPSAVFIGAVALILGFLRRRR
jgi:hypothetical protein